MRRSGIFGFAISMLIASSSVFANDPCAPNITPEGLDFSLPCSISPLPSPELRPRVYFEPNSTSLDEDAKKNLDSKIEILKRYPEVVLNLKGYADTVEAPKPNDRLTLGLARAKSVEAYLIDRGILDSRIAAAGVSHVQMIPKNRDPASLALMRYVLIVVEPY